MNSSVGLQVGWPIELRSTNVTAVWFFTYRQDEWKKEIIFNGGGVANDPQFQDNYFHLGEGRSERESTEVAHYFLAVPHAVATPPPNHRLFFPCFFITVILLPLRTVLNYIVNICVF